MSATNDLIEEFSNMKKMRIIEVEGSNGEYFVFNVSVNQNYLKGSCTTHDLKDVNIRWDTCFSLDEHLETLLEKIQIAIDKSLANE
jgi:hypothetical protein